MPVPVPAIAVRFVAEKSINVLRGLIQNQLNDLRDLRQHKLYNLQQIPIRGNFQQYALAQNELIKLNRQIDDIEDLFVQVDNSITPEFAEGVGKAGEIAVNLNILIGFGPDKGESNDLAKRIRDELFATTPVQSGDLRGSLGIIDLEDEEMFVIGYGEEYYPHVRRYYRDVRNDDWVQRAVDTVDIEDIAYITDDGLVGVPYSLERSDASELEVELDIQGGVRTLGDTFSAALTATLISDFQTELAQYSIEEA